MSRKRPISSIDEPNNNDDETETMDKKRCTMNKRLMSELESNLTDKMIAPIKSPNGQPTSRFGRKITKFESTNVARQRKSTPNSHVDQPRQKKTPQSKRKTHPTALNIEPDLKTNENDSSICMGTVDYEDDLKQFYLPKSVEIIDLTSSPDGSECEHECKTASIDSDVQSIGFAIGEIDSTTHRSPHKTDFQKESIPMVDEIATSFGSNTNLFNDDKQFSDEKSDDCIITDDETNINDICSTTNLYVGQIVWAALFGYPFWPAIIFNEKESQTFRKDNQIHVKFLYDNGRRNWVNEKSSILPFQSREEFAAKCKLPVNKRNKAFRINKCKKWEIAIIEANVLSCIRSDQRLTFYDTILLKAIHKKEQELRSSRRKTNDRCDTPQTFDTAYSSMKQSSSPVSLSSTLNEPDRNYNVDKINNYFRSVELSHFEELPEEDLPIDDSPSFAASVASSSSTEQINCQFANVVFEMFRNDDVTVDRSAISHEIQFIIHLNELWSKLVDSKQTKNSANNSLVTKRISRQFSIDSLRSNISTFTHQQTKRQQILAEKRALEQIQLQKSKMADKVSLVPVKATKDEIDRKKQQETKDVIQGCYIKSHPANFLLKGLAKDPVCQCCLLNGNVIKCAGSCGAFYHRQCLKAEIKESEYFGILKRKMRKSNEEKTANGAVNCIGENVEKLLCLSCTSPILHCFVCMKSDESCIQCCEKNCGKAYHLKCLKYWPQHKKEFTNKSIKSLTCSRHVCHTCVSPDIRKLFHNTESDKKLIKCLLCPGTYHRSSECIPAGSELLSESQLICARHQIKTAKRVNINYCLFCSNGGSLICCDACPNAFHLKCLPKDPNRTEDPNSDDFNCEECETGRRPLNGEIVWCKYHTSKWWPSIIVPPPRIPPNVLSKKKEPNQICVFFFGTHEYGWVPQANIYLYLLEDCEYKNNTDGQSLKNAVAEAEHWMKIFNENNEKISRTMSKNNKPPPYRKIKTNKVVAKSKDHEYEKCKCREDHTAPCSTENECENVATSVECDPELCPAKEKCQNQNFHRGERFAFEVKMTGAKGWGLFAKEVIPIGEFIIEYMGEVIDNVEFKQRYERATDNKDENFYFLKLESLYIDAKLYGNEARFINHSCDPNAKPDKWTVYSNGQAFNRIGFFALQNIQPGEEITFDYNWGTKKTGTVCVCQCGSKKCRGHI